MSAELPQFLKAHWIYFVLLGLITWSLYLTYAEYRTKKWRKSLELKTKELTKRYKKLDGELLKFNELVDQLTSTLESMDKQVNHQQKKIDIVQQSMPKSHYHQAKTIAKLGGDASSLQSECGLSKVEASIMKALNQKQSEHSNLMN